MYENPSSVLARESMISGINQVSIFAKKLQPIDKNLYDNISTEYSTFVNFAATLNTPNTILSKEDLTKRLKLWRALKKKITNTTTKVNEESILVHKQYAEMPKK